MYGFSSNKNSSRLSTLAGLLILALHGPASAATALSFKQDEGSFTAKCDPEMAKVSVGYGQTSADDAFLPNCEMDVDPVQTQFSCTCEQNAAPVSGTFGSESLIPPNETTPQPARITTRCEDLLEEHCGPFAKPVEVECGDLDEDIEPGCIVAAWATKSGGRLTSLEVACSCSPRAFWAISATSMDGFELNEAHAQTLCEAHLAGCAEADGQGPLPAVNELVPGESMGSTMVECARYFGPVDDSEEYCGLGVDDQSIEIECECADGSTNVLGQTKEGNPSARELTDLCFEKLNACGAKPPAKSPEQPKPAPPAPEQQPESSGGGCKSSVIGAQTGVLWALLGVAALGRRRRRGATLARR